MLTAIGLIIAGLVLLILGGDFLVRAAQDIAGLQGHPDIAVSNVVGSNIFNILVVVR
jgi:Ca2+/Na+ antiporter